MSDTYTISLPVTGWLASNWMAYRWGLHSKKVDRIEATKSTVIARRRGFVAFLRGWRAEFDRLHLQTGGFDRDRSTFTDVITTFVEQSELVRFDFCGDARKRFESLVTTIAKCNAGHFDNSTHYKKFLEDFDALVDYVDAA